MLNFDAAQQLLLTAAKNQVPRTENLPLADLSGRVLAQTVISNINVPPEDNSAMDGIAFAFSDFQSDKILPISGKAFAGMAAIPLELGTAVRLFTGSIIPEGADTVVLQEDCEFFYDDNGELLAVDILESPKKGQHIRLAGEDISVGAEVAAAGMTLNARYIGLLASVGVAQADVYKPLRVGVLATGDELVAAGGQLQSGQVFNSNLPMLTAQLQDMGCIVDARHVVDDLDLIIEHLQGLAKLVDVIITIGGVSVGDADLVKTAIEAVGELNLWKVAMKPGKPLSFGQVKSESFRHVDLIGLPGNPVSAFATFELFAKPYLQLRAGSGRVKTDVLREYPVVLNKTLQPKREEFIRVQLCFEKGEGVLKPYAKQGSGVLSSVAWATGFARIPAGQIINDGDRVRYYAFA